MTDSASGKNFSLFARLGYIILRVAGTGLLNIGQRAIARMDLDGWGEKTFAPFSGIDPRSRVLQVPIAHRRAIRTRVYYVP